MVFSRQPHSLLHLQALVLTACFLLYEKRLMFKAQQDGNGPFLYLWNLQADGGKRENPQLCACISFHLDLLSQELQSKTSSLFN